MEFWPADFRTNVSSASAQKKRKGKATHVTEQHLEPGSLGVATLVSRGGPLEWITTFQPRRKYMPRVVGTSLEVFPPTKQLPSRSSRLSIHQRAEQGARFLRTYHPDVDIPFKLLKDELQSDEEGTAADSVLDPYVGNRLAHSFFENKRKKIMHFLAFPCGNIGSDLNVSPFRVTRDKQILFAPSAAPVLSFSTPIQQVITFPSMFGARSEFSLLAIRTHSAVSIVKVRDSSADQLHGNSLTATTEMSISLPDTGGHRVVDVSGTLFSTSDAQSLLINGMGSVYSFKIERPEKTTIVADAALDSGGSQADQFWRIIRRDINIGMRSSSKTVQLFDLRTGTAPWLIPCAVNGETEFLTSIEAPLQGHHLMCFSTSDKLVWVDERHQQGPILSLRHHRAFDRTLRAETVDYGRSPLIMLSSSRNSLVTVYDVNYSSAGYIHMYGEPSMLTGSPSATLPLGGSAYFRHSAAENQDFNMFQLSSTGSLWRTEITFSEDKGSSTEKSLSEVSDWTPGMHELAGAMREDTPPLGDREFVDADLRGAYEKIFQMHQAVSDVPVIDAEAVYQTLEKMPFFWQDMDGPVDHMLLTFDVAFRSGMEPFHASRADFLTQSLLSSPQGFAALTRERIPIPRLISTVRWHYDLRSLPVSMFPNVTTRSIPLTGQLREEALAYAATADGMKRATEAAQHVTLDLALSRHVYAPQSFLTERKMSNSEADESILSQATQAMSLGVAEPPGVQFGFLRPVTNMPYDEDERIEDDHESTDVGAELPLGIRLLLSQWEDGTDPQKYLYKDPYLEPGASSTPQKVAQAKRVDPSASGQDQYQPAVPPVISVPRVPPVVASTSQSLNTMRTASMFDAETHPTVSDTLRPTSSQGPYAPSTHIFSSQEQGPSTQPLPGAFGGGNRQQKKQGRRRMGGF